MSSGPEHEPGGRFPDQHSAKAGWASLAGNALHIEAEQRPDGVVLLICSGALDVATTPVLLDHVRRVLRGGPRGLCIDLCSVGALDAAGITALVTVRRFVLRANGALTLCSIGRPRQRLFAAGVEGYFDIESTRQQALRRLS